MAFYDEGGEQPYPIPVPMGRGEPRPMPGGRRRRLRPLNLPGIAGGMNSKAALLAALRAGILPGGGGPMGHPGMQSGPPGGGGAEWGGQHYNDPMALWKSEVQHGNQGTFESFYQQHPGLQNKFDLAVTPPGGRRPRINFANALRAAKRRRPNPGGRPYPMPRPGTGEFHGGPIY